MPSPPLEPAALRRGPAWIHSAAFDGAFFLLSPVLILPLVGLFFLGFEGIANRLALMLAFAHYFSTATFFAWDDNRPYHRRRWLAFFAGPVAIALGVALLVRLEVPWILQVALFFWNTYHVARQNCGLLSLYRHRAGVVDPAQKSAANLAIVAGSLWLALWNVGTHVEVAGFLGLVSLRLPWLLWAGLGLVTVLALARFARALGERAREGTLHLPEAAFAVTSFAIFHPYLWAADSRLATSIMLLPHYVQYLGLVWLLQRRRFESAARGGGERALRFLSFHPLLLAGVLVGSGVGVLGLQSLAFRSGRVDDFYSFYLVTAFLHFYLDGLFWAFKDPHVRASIGPYLVSYKGAPAAARPAPA